MLNDCLVQNSWPIFIGTQSYQLSEGWVLKFDRSKTCGGRCYYQKKVIALSLDYINNVPAITRADVVDTILHEFAHAIAGPFAGHGPIWHYIAKCIGCSANVHCKQIIYAENYRYVIKCPCGCVRYRHRLLLAKQQRCATHNQVQSIFDRRFNKLI